MRLNREHEYSGMNPLSGKMWCGLCGKPYGVRYWHGRPVWQCREKSHKHCTCSNTHIYDHALGLYPGDEATRVFAEALKDFDVSKGTIRIPWNRALPETLIREIARWCYEEYRK